MFDEKIKELKATIETLSLTIATKTAEVKAALEAEDLETAKALKAAETKQMKTAKPKVYKVLNKGDKTPFKTSRYAYKHYYQVRYIAF